MTRWPPILWICIFAGSLLLLNGWDGAETNPQSLIPGIVLVVGAAGASLWLALGHRRDRPPTGTAWLVAGTVVFYLLCAGAAMAAGGAYAIAAMAAGLIPLTAAALLSAASRVKTVSRGDHRDDASAAASDDPFPGIGGDDATPLGDTSEHSDAERVARPGDRFGRPGRTSAR